MSKIVYSGVTSEDSALKQWVEENAPEGQQIHVVHVGTCGFSTAFANQAYLAEPEYLRDGRRVRAHPTDSSKIIRVYADSLPAYQDIAAKKLFYGMRDLMVKGMILCDEGSEYRAVFSENEIVFVRFPHIDQEGPYLYSRGTVVIEDDILNVVRNHNGSFREKSPADDHCHLKLVTATKPFGTDLHDPRIFILVNETKYFPDPEEGTDAIPGRSYVVSTAKEGEVRFVDSDIVWKAEMVPVYRPKM